jgi:hypothetical protein
MILSANSVPVLGGGNSKTFAKRVPWGVSIAVVHALLTIDIAMHHVHYLFPVRYFRLKARHNSN